MISKNLKYNFSESASILIKRVDECIHKKLQYIERLTEGKDPKQSVCEKKSNKNHKSKEDKFTGHANTINEFWKVISRFNELQDDIIKGDQKHKIYNSISDYMEIVKDAYIKCELFKSASLDETSEILEDIENYIMKKLYKR
jgi:hypothetical protein